MIIEALIASYEVDAVAVRTEELRGVVDHRVICEATTTFHGRRPAPQRYFNTDTQTVIRLDLPPGLSPMGCEMWLRDHALTSAMTSFPQPENWFIVADGDEIPHPRAIGTAITLGSPAVLATDYREWYMDWRGPDGWQLFHQPVIGQRDHFMAQGGGHAARMSRMGGAPQMEARGWHLSTLGDAALASHKLSTFAHDEYADSEHNNLAVLADRRKRGRDLLDRFDLEWAPHLPLCAVQFPHLLAPGDEQEEG